MERKIKKYNNYIYESKENLQDVLDSFLELSDDNIVKYNGLGLILSAKDNQRKLAAFFDFNVSNIIKINNIDNYIELFSTVKYAFERVNISEFEINIKNQKIYIAFDIKNKLIKEFVSILEKEDYFYYIETDKRVFYEINFDINDDFTFKIKVYEVEKLESKENIISYFEKYSMKLVDIIKEPNKYDEYVFEGSFM
jgi:hypothetical protein